MCASRKPSALCSNMQQQSLDISVQGHLFSRSDSFSFHFQLISSELIQALLISTHVIFSNLISSHLLPSQLSSPSHVTSSPFVSSHLFSPVLTSAKLFSAVLTCSQIISALLWPKTCSKTGSRRQSQISSILKPV